MHHVPILVEERHHIRVLQLTQDLVARLRPRHPREVAVQPRPPAVAGRSTPTTTVPALNHLFFLPAGACQIDPPSFLPLPPAPAWPARIHHVEHITDGSTAPALSPDKLHVEQPRRRIQHAAAPRQRENSAHRLRIEAVRRALVLAPSSNSRCTRNLLQPRSRPAQFQNLSHTPGRRRLRGLVQLRQQAAHVAGS